MKKFFIIAFLFTLVMSGLAQQNHYDFAETVESGQTLYFLKGYYGPQDVMVTYPCYHDTVIYNSSGASTQITTYYYGHEEPSGDLVIPSTIIHNDTTYTVTTIGYNAFWKCTNITTLTLPNTLNSIIQGAFSGCTGITGEVAIPNSVTHLGDDAFRSCTHLNSVVFGNALPKIGGCAFKGCTSLEHISPLPKSLTRIYDEAFAGCSILSGTIVIPPLVTQIDESVFAYCNISSVIIPEGVERINRLAFAACPLDSLFIPSSVTSISVTDSYGGGAFLGCTHLQSIVVDEANSVYDSRDKCNAIVETATNTIHVGCQNTIIPNTINRIGYSAFAGCLGLHSITIPHSVSYFGKGAFEGCDSLSTITLSSSVSYISDRALACSGLTSITCQSPIPPRAIYEISSSGYFNSFGGYDSWVNSEIPIFIPLGTTEAYRNASGWNYFFNFIETEMNLEGEWYYEIVNDNGHVTYQHLQYSNDTVINDKDNIKVIVRTNHIYDKEQHQGETHEYLFEDRGKVYWWNKTLEEFTTLYDFTAEEGDEWEMKVGTESLVMHVDSVGVFDYQGHQHKVLHVSDAGGMFGGDIVIGLGHMASFFPEKLMSRGEGFTVEGLRCFWVEDALVYDNGDEDCDAVYLSIHEVEENNNEKFSVYPNPTDGLIHVETLCAPSSQEATTYRITNPMGQVLMRGTITNPTVDVSALPAGMYFITIGNQIVKLMKQ